MTSSHPFDRRYVIYLILVIIFLGLVFRIVTLHLSKTNNEETLRERGIFQSIKSVLIKGYRGNIVDRNNKIMALTVPLKSVIIDPEQLINYLSADYLDHEKQDFINQFSPLVRQKLISQSIYKKVAKLLNIKTKKLTNLIKNSNHNTKTIVLRKSSDQKTQKLVNKLIDQYSIEQTNAIFSRKINQKIYQKIAKVFMMTSQELKTALINSPSRKRLKIQSNLELNSQRLSDIYFLKNTAHKVSYKNNRYKEIPLGGAILLESNAKRYYPQARTAAALLGLTNKKKSFGIEGLEKTYNHILRSKDGKKEMAVAGDKEYYADVRILVEPKQGNDLQLTIDNNIQYFAYAALKKAVDKHKGAYGAAIVTNADGEILAMANYPSINPNDRSHYNPTSYRNRILLDAIEVGSTMKPFTTLLGLEKQRITPNEVIDLTQAIGRYKPDKHKKLTPTQIIQKSHNLGIVTIGQRLTKEEMWDMFVKLRFGQATGVMLNMENSGLLKHYDDWHLSDKRALAFGYGPMHTTLAQLARAYLIFLNQGKIRNLTLIKNDKTDKQTTQIFSPKVIAQMVKILDSTVSQTASGYAAQIKGYDVAGKTGTTRLLKKDGSGYDKARHGTFFAGFAPSYQAKYLAIVQIHDPAGRYSSGSNVAAPAFKEIMENILKFNY